jgi:hypothetical protein
MKVIINVIEHDEQPYDTVGDWRFEGEDGKPIKQEEALSKANTCGCVLRINVSRMGNWKYEMMVAVHELVETLLCMKDCVDVETVDAFDKEFEAKRAESDEREPGDDAEAPYMKQHCVATGVERILCAAMGEGWTAYDLAVMGLPEIEGEKVSR